MKRYGFLAHFHHGGWPVSLPPSEPLQGLPHPMWGSLLSPWWLASEPHSSVSLQGHLCPRTLCTLSPGARYAARICHSLPILSLAICSVPPWPAVSLLGLSPPASGLLSLLPQHTSLSPPVRWSCPSKPYPSLADVFSGHLLGCLKMCNVVHSALTQS